MTSDPAYISLDTTEPDIIIKLISKDEKEFSIKKEYAFISNLVKTSLDSDTHATEVPLPSVKSETLEFIVEYMNHHKGVEVECVEKPLRSKIMKDVCKDPWDAQFIDSVGTDMGNLYDLSLVANYMDIKSLLHLTCAKIASCVKGQPLEKVREILSRKKN